MRVKPRTRPSQGDAVLMSYLEPNRPDLAKALVREVPSASESEDESESEDDSEPEDQSESEDESESRDKVYTRRRVAEAPVFSNLSYNVPFSPAPRKIKSRVGHARRLGRLDFERNTGKARPFSDLSDGVPSHPASYEPASLRDKRLNYERNGKGGGSILTYQVDFPHSDVLMKWNRRHNPKAKTVICRFWPEGKCKKGDDCTFIHES
ncbi:hypothetical protein GJ744_006302 [Endocarpon pusillum]|uniref:C3H1-type domain-containing protein n=1 Tax=Endocarpon pusillum TaxID=364733 RepID=A0A8H7A6V7_9EURO|nr:hypothetical protein GJ744_006302 [Endocarpon pusillum]